MHRISCPAVVAVPEDEIMTKKSFLEENLLLYTPQEKWYSSQIRLGTDKETICAIIREGAPITCGNSCGDPSSRSHA